MSGRKAKLLRLPEEMAAELDELVERGAQNDFIVEATRERLERLRLRNAMDSIRGALKEEDYPQFRTPADTSRWVRELRERGYEIPAVSGEEE